jgi:hypothetical protein
LVLISPYDVVFSVDTSSFGNTDESITEALASNTLFSMLSYIFRPPNPQSPNDLEEKSPLDCGRLAHLFTLATRRKERQNKLIPDVVMLETGSNPGIPVVRRIRKYYLERPTQFALRHRVTRNQGASIQEQPLCSRVSVRIRPAKNRSFVRNRGH